MTILDTYKSGGGREKVTAIRELRNLRSWPKPKLKACKHALRGAAERLETRSDADLHYEATMGSVIGMGYQSISLNRLSYYQRERLSLALSDHQATPEGVTAGYDGDVPLNREQILSRAIDNIMRNEGDDPSEPS